MVALAEIRWILKEVGREFVGVEVDFVSAELGWKMRCGGNE